MNNSRNNWTVTTLGEIRTEKLKTINPMKAANEYFELYSVPQFVEHKPAIVEGKEIGSSKQIVKENVVLLCKINPRINRVWVVGNHSDHTKIASTEWIAFPKILGIDPRYLCYFMMTNEFRNFLSMNVSGVGGSLMRVKPSVINDYPFPLAPEKEQPRIVSKVEELFSELDAGIDYLNTIKLKLRSYRRSVLSSLGGEAHPLDAVIHSLTQGWSPRCERRAAHDDSQWGVIKTTAVQALQYDDSAHKTLPDALKPREHLEIKAGDVLVTRAGPRKRVGVSCFVKKTRPHLMVCDKVYRLRIRADMAYPEYIVLALNAQNTLRALDKIKTGINDSGLNLTQDRFVKLEIPLPSLKKQEAMIDEIESRLSVADKVEQVVETNLKRAESLRQSILKKAFRGKLVPQDPNDEPAEKLLERIKAEKAGKSNIRNKS